MNKNLLFFLVVIVIMAFYSFKLDKTIKNMFYSFNTTIKEIYITSYDNVYLLVTRYFNQVQNIRELQQYIKTREKLNIDVIQNKYMKDSNATIVKVLSYVEISNFSKVFVKVDFEFNKTIPIITNNGYSAGIIINKDGQHIAYLNHNPKANYTVFIGSNKIPGITHGDQYSPNIEVRFIPRWQNIKIGDEVITSGMDSIFNFGIKVGKVISIDESSATYTAIVKPYASVYDKDYFYTNIPLKQ